MMCYGIIQGLGTLSYTISKPALFHVIPYGIWLFHITFEVQRLMKWDEYLYEPCPRCMILNGSFEKQGILVHDLFKKTHTEHLLHMYLYFSENNIFCTYFTFDIHVYHKITSIPHAVVFFKFLQIFTVISVPCCTSLSAP